MMSKWESRTVDQFKVGDHIRLYGWEGRVMEINHQMVTADKNGYCTNNPKNIAMEVPCTYLRVCFDNPKEVGYQYENGWYGGKDGVVAHECQVG